MTTTPGYVALRGTVHSHPKDHQKIGFAQPSDKLAVTLMLRRKIDAVKHAVIVDRAASPPTRQEFIEARGANQDELNKVVESLETERQF